MGKIKDTLKTIGNMLTPQEIRKYNQASKKKALRKYLRGRVWHGFRTFRVDKDKKTGDETITDVVDSEYVCGKYIRRGRKVKGDLTIKKSARVKGYEKCRCGSSKQSKNCCGTRLKEE